MFLLQMVAITPYYKAARQNLFPYWYEWLLLVSRRRDNGPRGVINTRNRPHSRLGLVKRVAAVRADQPERQKRIGLGKVGGSTMERDRRGVSFGRLLRARVQLESSDGHVPPEPNVRHVVLNGLRTNLGLPVVPPSVRALGHNNRRFDEGPGEISRRVEHFRVRVFHADRRYEPPDQQEIGKEVQRRVIFGR